MDFTTVNLLGVMIAAIAAFIVGSVYYPLMSKPWLKATRRDPTTIKMSYSPFVISFIGELVMALALALVLGAITLGNPDDYSITMGLMWGFVLWLGFAAMTMTINHRYGGYGWDLTLIDGFHWLLVILAMGAVLGWFGPPEVTLT
ncbi:DUF1761 domain-containing protein [Rhizobium sp. TH2]|uniref:DUF1761 domain-containing protein n=1 Tax=Rhizobium sp. TH2 TaxID=2775403 RepID=UPI0021574B73|nr:DUF1761 domain-containing protein [Rhizobium sp. TH2]UVC08384.1 DUF1761 domain-containing protein [Rhizobium sp. TH2]